MIYPKSFEFGDNQSENITRYYSVIRSGALSRPYPRKTSMYYEARLYCKVDRLWEIVGSWNELLCADRKPGNLEETKINSNFFSIAVDSRHFAGSWVKRSSESGAVAQYISTTFVKKNQARSNDINHANTYSAMK